MKSWTPEARVREVVEVRFLRGAGVVGDPAREILAYRDADGTLLAQRDPLLADPDHLRDVFRDRGWSIHMDDRHGQDVDPFAWLAEVLG